MIKAFLLPCLWLAFFHVTGARANSSPIERILTRADDMKLHQKSQWLRLLHYHDRLFSKESTLDSQAFFLSPDGKSNPERELKATLKAFFAPVADKPEREGKHKTYTHPQCLFPARYAWLKQQLGFDNQELPEIDCVDFNQFKQDTGVQNASLIFTSAYMGNPASFFGHTLLRLDAQEETPLLSYAVNYGALTGSDNGLAFMMKGVFGGYGGVFSVYPYYDTVNLYNNMENRDIWEYKLNLNDEKIKFLLAHVWELGHNSADYFFFSENCSYMILETVNVVYPETDLTRPFYHPLFSNYTIPADTVRVLLAQQGVLKKTVYRPSRQTRILHAYSLLSSKEKQALRKLLKAPRKIDEVAGSDLSATEKVNVFTTAYDYLQYRYVTKKVPLHEMRRDSVALLTALNAQNEKSSLPPPPEPTQRPDTGHKSGALAVSQGKRNGRAFTDFTIRPAYHTLLDSSNGFPPFGEIVYLDTTLRRYENGNDWRLQNFTFVGIQSRTPVSELFSPPSLHVKAGFQSWRQPSSAKDGYVFFAEGGAGYSYAPVSGVSVSAFVNGYGKAGGYLNKNALTGIGMQAAVAADLKKIRLTGEAAKIFYAEAPDETEYKAAAAISLSEDWSLTAGYELTEAPHYHDRSFHIGIQLYF